MSMVNIKTVFLKKNEDRRIRAGHLWVFSNEIDTKKTPLVSLQSGDIVNVLNHRGEPVGSGYINPHCLLCIRLFSSTLDQQLTVDFIAQRLMRALHLREKLFSQPFYRLIFGESDSLPGLIIDRYDTIFVAQINTAGMERQKENIIAALQTVLRPKALLWRNDSSARLQEQLPQEVLPAFGDPPQEVELIENNTHFIAPIWQGQKTGWFYDHRDNRLRMQNYVQNKTVLDVFSYVGAWGVQAATAGATQVTCIDSSAVALNYVQRQAAKNQVQSQITTLEADAFDALKLLAEQKQRFDVVIVDPPAFIKKRKDLPAGLFAYQKLNLLALRVLNDRGFLISSSCSHHLSREQLLAAILQASLKLKRPLVITAQGHQAADHPIHPAITETDYLKALFFAA